MLPAALRARGAALRWCSPLLATRPARPRSCSRSRSSTAPSRSPARGLTRGAVAAILEPAGLLREGNALFNVGFAVATVGGAALGGVLVAGLGRRAPRCCVDAASFASSRPCSLRRARAAGAAHAEREPLLRARRAAGSATSARDPRVRLLLGGQALALVLFTLVVPIEVVYAKETLGAGDAGFGALLAAWGGGIVLGSSLFFVARAAPLVAARARSSTAAVGVAYLGHGASSTTLAAACAFSVARRHRQRRSRGSR